ncbi:hypothetical protein ANN_21886 [Periplaneta americana]|uniref:Uncharacterized protein n=1 Tax=Periplaneta americana TaxID=6978 RepID=A0ABQ8S6V7_PERAM|nr:hypothetical protein ANN_21886 [Periplaneta americana]
MSPGSSTESYPTFAHLGLRENPGKNLNQVTCPDRESNPGHLVSRPDALTVTPQEASALRSKTVGCYRVAPVSRTSSSPARVAIGLPAASAKKERIYQPWSIRLKRWNQKGVLLWPSNYP